MKISACIIVKNELDTLPACLRTLIGYVDEIVIVDTGSVDGTEFLVEAWKAAHHNNGTSFVLGEWKDYKEWSFSEARNYAMSLASGDWLFTVDADDRIEINDWDEVLKFLKSDTDLLGEFDVVACTILNVYGNKALIGGSLTQPRFMRKSSNPVYAGRVHNNITFPTLGRPHNAIMSPMKIYHIGYGMLSPETLKNKTLRVIEMTKRDTEENPESAYAWFNYGNAVKSKMAESGWDESEKKIACDALDKAMKFAKTSENHHFIDAVTLKGWIHYQAKEFELADNCASLALREKRDHLDALLLKAFANADSDHLDIAEFYLKQYLIADEMATFSRKYDYVACQFRGHRDDAYATLAAIERRRRDTVDRRRAMLMN